MQQEQQYPLTEQLRVGQYVDIELQNISKDRFKTKIVGCKPSHYLVLEQPDIKKYGLLKDKLEELELLVLRTIFERTNGDCVAFNAYVMCKVSHPDKLLFVTYPEKIFHKCLRSEERKQVHFNACVYQEHNKQRRVDGVITNISSGGCCFECGVDSSVSGLKPDELTLELSMPDGAHKKVLHAELRSQRKVKGKLNIGFAFTDEENDFL